MELTLTEIASLIDAGKGENGYFAAQLESSFVPFFEKLKDIKQDKQKIDINNLFNMDEQLTRRFRKKYKKSMTKFLEVFSEKIGQLQSLKVEDLLLTENYQSGDSKAKLSPSKQPNNTNRKAQESTPLEEKETATKVHIESVSKDILGKFAMVNPKSQKLEIESKTEKPESKSGFFGKLFKGLLFGGATAVAAVAGAFFLREGFLSDSMFKGTLKLVGRALLEPIIKVLEKVLDPDFVVKMGANVAKLTSKLPLVGKMLAKPIAGLFKFAGKGASIVSRGIPFLGTLISFAFAYSRFKKGDNLGGLLEIGAGLASLIPAVGWMISGGIGIFLAARDLTTTSESRKNTVGSDIFKSIKDYLMKIPLVKSMVDLFSGLYKMFVAKNSADMDRAFYLLKRSKISSILPFLNPLWGMLELLKTGVDVDKVMSAVGNIGDFIGGIISKFWGFFNDIGVWIGNKLIMFMESNTGQILKLKFDNVILKLKESMFTLSDYISNFILDQANSMANMAGKDLILWGVEKAGFGSGVDKMREYGRSLRSDKAGDVAKEIQKNNKRVEELEKSRLEDQRKIEKEMHQEKMSNDAANAAAMIAATNGTTTAVAEGFGRSAGGNTTFLFNNDGKNSSRRSKDRGYRSIYQNQPAN